jgi:hypothetical protein
LECPVPGTRAGLFLTDYPRERTIPSIQPLETSGERILEEFSWLSDTKGCFLGVVRGDGETLQFMWDEGHTLEVDVPSPALQGSFKTTGSYEECRCLLASFLTGADVTSAPGLVFTLWK